MLRVPALRSPAAASRSRGLAGWGAAAPWEVLVLKRGAAWWCCLATSYLGGKITQVVIVMKSRMRDQVMSSSVFGGSPDRAEGFCSSPIVTFPGVGTEVESMNVNAHFVHQGRVGIFGALCHAKQQCWDHVHRWSPAQCQGPISSILVRRGCPSPFAAAASSLEAATPSSSFVDWG